MKHLKYLMTLVFLILLWNVSEASDIVFKDIPYLATELQQCQVLKDENKILYKQIDSYISDINISVKASEISEAQIRLLKKENEMHQKYSTSVEEFVGKYDILLKDQKNMYELIIKESKPSFWSKVKNTVGLIGIGILIGAGVVLF